MPKLIMNFPEALKGYLQSSGNFLTVDSLRHRRVWTTTLFALLIIAAALPWLGFRYGRPLLRRLTFDANVAAECPAGEV
jgi:hypothetical protein